jgi:omega-amidase
MKLILNQFNPDWEDCSTNLLKLESQWPQMASHGADLALLPEMFNTGFSMKAADVAEPLSGPAVSFLRKHAKRSNLPVVAGIALKRDDGSITNSAVVIDGTGEMVSIYDKIHPFTLAGEHLHYHAGKHPIVVDLAGLRFGVFICYDLRFPELFRPIAKQVDAMIVIANWPEVRIEHWSILLRARAIENQCYVVGLNRTGTDGNKLHYPASTVVFDSRGKAVEMEWISEELALVELDPATVAKTRSEMPFLQDFSHL